MFKPLTTGANGNELDYVRDQGLAPVPLDQMQPIPPDGSEVTLSSLLALGRGVHDIHMMQGNEESFAPDNRINGDGALFLRFGTGEIIALFVRFGTPATDTDDAGNLRQGGATRGHIGRDS